MVLGGLEAGVLGVAAGIAMKSMDLAIRAVEKRWNGRGGGTGKDDAVLSELKILNAHMQRTLVNQEKHLTVLEETRGRVVENQESVHQIQRDVLLLKRVE